MSLRIVCCLFACCLFIQSSSVKACPGTCSCFGFGGEWITDCTNRGLTSVPTSEIDTNTTELLLQMNEITDLPVGSFGGLPNIRYLYLQENTIQTVAKEAFQGLTSLEYLRIHNNELTSLDIDFSHTPNLKLLLAQNNWISSLSKENFLGLSNIEIMSFGANGLTNIDTDAFCDLTSLKNLDLSGWSVAIPDVATFECIDNLETLYMNNINTLQCDDQLREFKEWGDDRTNPLHHQLTMRCGSPESLQGVFLSSLSVKNLVASDACPDQCACFMNIVDCANRGLTSIPGNISGHTKELFLQGNDIRALPANDMLHLPNLAFLYLHDNMLSTINELAFNGIGASLRTLTLHDNQIRTLPTAVFRDAVALQVLNLNDNLLTRISSVLLTNATNLVQISFYNNQIDTIGDIAFNGLSKLRYLGLANNLLTQAPELSGAEYPDLYLVDVADNRLESLPKVPSTANQVYANGNAVKSLESATFADATQLYELFLIDNQVSTIENNAFAGAENLGWIDLTGNSLSSVNDNMFTNLPNLQGLYLGSNLALDQVTTNAFSSFSSSLRRLSLNNCSFSQLDPKALSYLTNSDLVLWLAHNPWYCDCKLKQLAAYVVDTTVNDVEDTRCTGPKDLTGHRIDYVNFNALCQDLGLIIALPIVCAVLLFLGATVVLFKIQGNEKIKDLPDENQYEIEEQGKNGVVNEEFDKDLAKSEL